MPHLFKILRLSIPISKNKQKCPVLPSLSRRIRKGWALSIIYIGQASNSANLKNY